MTTQVRVAMIGAGSMANHVHYPLLASFDDVEIAASCDLDPQRLNITVDKYEGDTQGIAFDTRQVAGSNDLFVYGGFQAKNREFIDAVKQKTLPSSHFGDALKTMEVAEIILAQTLLRR